MTPTRWARVRFVLETALDMPAAERAAFLDNASKEDRDLRAEVEDLLAQSDQAGTLFAVDRWRMEIAPEIHDPIGPGTRLGPFRLTEEIGSGGMGTVYAAERDDGQFSQRVAVKLLRTSVWNEDMIRRFRQERQILARLDHPGIARLLDGGVTEDGRPYLVMEYVEGQPINRYCDDRRLPVRERLALFLQVCPAVQTAHQALVVHRDLKPANILITADGRAKLLDFGIAKLLEEGDTAGKVRSTLSLLTPAYASPEQVRGEPAGTASDVYALGTLLYELLTSRLPVGTEDASPLETARAICEEEAALASRAVRPPKANEEGTDPEAVAFLRRTTPAGLSRTLSGDLDTILRQTLRKEPARRYATVEAFAADLDRHLRGLPVQARRDTLVYRTSKFLGRHTGLAAAALVIFTLFVLGAAAIWRARQAAERQQALAESRFADVRDLAHSFVFEVDDALAPILGSTAVRGLINVRAMTYLERLSGDAGNNPDLQREIAQGYERLAFVQGTAMSASLGDRASALDTMSKALSLRLVVLNRFPDSAVDRGALVKTLCYLGRMYLSDGDAVRAKALDEEAWSAAQPLVALGPTIGDPYLSAGYVQYFLGLDYAGIGFSTHLAEPERAIAHHQQAMDMLDRWGAANPGQSRYSEAKALLEQAFGTDYLVTGQLTEAKRHLQRGMALAATPKEGLLRRFDGRTWATLRYFSARVSIESGNPRAALGPLYAILPPALEGYRMDPNNLRGRLDLATTEALLGRADVLSGNIQSGFRHLENAISDQEQILVKDPGWAELRGSLALHYVWAGDCAAAIKNWTAARRRYRQAKQLAGETLQAHASDANASEQLAMVAERMSHLGGSN